MLSSSDEVQRCSCETAHSPCGGCPAASPDGEMKNKVPAIFFRGPTMDRMRSTKSPPPPQVSVGAGFLGLRKQEHFETWWTSLQASMAWASSVQDSCSMQEAALEAPLQQLAAEAKRCRGPDPGEVVPCLLAVREWRSSRARPCRDGTLVAQLNLEM